MTPSKSLLHYPKVLCRTHSYIAEFLGASIVICLCLMILMPQVHDSFSEHDSSDVDDSDDFQVKVPDIEPQHHHSHSFPTGEVIICAGFLLFYCIGLGLDKTHITPVGNQIVQAKRRDSTICCSSTRCPASQPTTRDSQESIVKIPGTEIIIGNKPTDIETAECAILINDRNVDDDCVLLLNRHHNHHMHTKHHDHNLHQNGSRQTLGYGSTSARRDSGLAQEIQDDDASKLTGSLRTEEISINLLEPRDRNRDPGWSRPMKMTLFCLIVAAILIVLDLNIRVTMESMKVIKAATTGALLYLAFFLIFPKDEAGCNSCTNEEQTN